MRELTGEVPAAASGHTLSSYIKERWHMADSLLRHLKWQPGAVLLNGHSARLRDVVQAGDCITVHLEEADGRPADPAAAPPTVLWEDEDLLVFNKPAGMAVYGTYYGGGVTVADTLAAYRGPEQIFHPVNRLDIGTSGAMVVAKSRFIHDRLRQMLHTEDFIRTYLAVTAGVPSPTTGVIDAPIGQAPDSFTRRVISPDGLPARTVYRTVAENEDSALLEVKLQTGRTHQIRVHLQWLGVPLVGDCLYGNPSPLIDRPALHARAIRLRHPLTEAVIDVEAPLPADMKYLISKL